MVDDTADSPVVSSRGADSGADDAPPEREAVAWDVAQRVAHRALALTAPLDLGTRLALEEDFAWATTRAEELVTEITGLSTTAGPTRSVVVDRGGWVDANVGSFQRLLRPISQRFAEEGTNSGLIGQVGSGAAGVEVGLLLAWISRRVLGQYDLFPAGEERADAVYYVGPNIVTLERRHGFAPRDFRLWIAVHEVTHRMQFTAVEWMRPYFLGLVERGMRLTSPDAKAILDSLMRAVGEIRAGRNPLAEGGVVALLASGDQLEMLREAQALMSLLEGHSDVVMDSVSDDIIPGAQRFSRTLAERRQNVKGGAKLIQQVLGLEAKLRQYQEGEHFVREVLDEGGDELFRHVWESAENLPTIAEIREPSLWTARVRGVAEATT